MVKSTCLSTHPDHPQFFTRHHSQSKPHCTFRTTTITTSSASSSTDLWGFPPLTYEDLCTYGLPSQHTCILHQIACALVAPCFTSTSLTVLMLMAQGGTATAVVSFAPSASTSRCDYYTYTFVSLCSSYRHFISLSEFPYVCSCYNG